MKKTIVLLLLLSATMIRSADINNVDIQDFKVYMSVSGLPTLVGFVVRNNNPDTLSGAVLTVQPGNGVADLPYILPAMAPGQLLPLIPQWVYNTTGMTSGNIRLEYNSAVKNVGFSANVLVPNQTAITGQIIDANTGLPMTCNVHYGLYRTTADTAGHYSLSVQVPNFNYLMFARLGYYVWVDSVRLYDSTKISFYGIPR
jgi:hypothetical protein